MPTPSFASECANLVDVMVVICSKISCSDCAGVFRVGIDLSVAQRLPQNDGAAHALAMFGGNSGIDERALAISPSTYDSVNFFEPMTIGAADSRMNAGKGGTQEETRKGESRVTQK